MPNIEIHGFRYEAAKSDGHVKNAIELREAIFSLFKDEPFLNDMVVSFCPDFTVDCHLKNQPFLRVVSTPSAHVSVIVERLKTLHIDIEVQELLFFFPKE